VNSALPLVLSLVILATPVTALGIQWDSRPAEPVLTVRQDRIYRAGVFLIVDALIENTSSRTVERAEVLVELYDHSGELLRVEHALLGPTPLGPGQVAAMRILTPHTDAVRRLHYRFTWRHGNEQWQAVSQRDVWAIGSPTREAASGQRSNR
jgi:hypothetical protein